MTAKTILPRFDMGLANSIKWPMRMRKRFKLIGLAIVLAMATAMTDCSDPSADSVDSQQRIAPLLKGLGSHTHPVTTRSPLAQRYFDQGLNLVYAFNHAEAVRSFRQAALIDPDCAMAYWGQALALGPNLNAPVSPEHARQAYEATKLAQQSKASDRERAYTNALVRRYSADEHADRKALDRAYASAMRNLAEQYPDDDDAQTLYAAACVCQRPACQVRDAAAHQDRVAGGPLGVPFQQREVDVGLGMRRRRIERTLGLRRRLQQRTCDAGPEQRGAARDRTQLFRDRAARIGRVCFPHRHRSTPH